MNGSDTLLEAWKAKAEARRQMLAQVLNRKPANAAVAALREQYLKNAQTTVNNRKNWVQAYHAHLQALAQTLTANPSAGVSGKSSSKGSLGE